MSTEARRATFRGRSGTALIFVLSLLLIGSAAAKFVPKPASQMAMLGFSGNSLLLISFLEATSAVLVMIPQSRSLGLLLVSAYLGGAIAAHIGHAQLLAALRPAIVLAIFWTAVWLRNPEMLWSLAASASSSRAPMENSEFRQVVRGA